MAMLPFCGYNMADYFGHWLAMGRTIPRPPAIFHVNWFRQNEAGKFIWPGFGENMRVLRWMIDRCKGGGGAVESPIGYLPAKGAIDTSGLDVDAAMMEELTVACILAAALVGPAVSRAQVDAVPYGADGWRYQTYADAAAIPAEWASRTFDDSGFDTGAMPLGSWETGGAHCPLASEAR